MLFQLLVAAAAFAIGRASCSKEGVSRVHHQDQSKGPESSPSQEDVFSVSGRSTETTPEGAETEVFTEDLGDYLTRIEVVLVESGNDWRIYKLIKSENRDGIEDEEEDDYFRSFFVRSYSEPWKILRWLIKPKWHWEMHSVSWDAMWHYGYNITHFNSLKQARRFCS